MPPRLIWLLVFIYTLCAAAQSNGLTCIPRGICEKCPEEALHQPFCQPFGNRRLMHCHNSTSSVPPPITRAPSTNPDDDDGQSNPGEETRPHYAKRPPSDPPPDTPPLPNDGDAVDVDDDDENVILAWESCGRVVATERADFFEFATVNTLFVCVGIGVVIWRSRRMRVLHARQLAARIGMVGRRR